MEITDYTMQGKYTHLLRFHIFLKMVKVSDPRGHDPLGHVHYDHGDKLQKTPSKNLNAQEILAVLMI